MFANTPLIAALPASDLDRAKAWYSEKLGLEPVWEDEYGGAHYEAGGSRFLVFVSPFAGTNQATAAGFTVENFDEMIEDLRAKGVTFEEVDFGEMGKTVDGVISSADGMSKAAWFKDSEGNILSLSTLPPA
ncbi:MAG TPA: VOC family protein [Acidimicrobiia bacterium]|nr:VOC family protein [Acidimicrobiia bacterium]